MTECSRKFHLYKKGEKISGLVNKTDERLQITEMKQLTFQNHFTPAFKVSVICWKKQIQ